MRIFQRGGLLERTNRGLLHTIEFIKEALLVQRFTGELPNSQLFYLFLFCSPAFEGNEEQLW